MEKEFYRQKTSYLLFDIKLAKIHFCAEIDLIANERKYFFPRYQFYFIFTALKLVHYICLLNLTKNIYFNYKITDINIGIYLSVCLTTQESHDGFG